MDSVVEIPGWLALVLKMIGVLLVIAGFAVYGRVVRKIVRQGGKVRTDHFNAADLLVASLFILWFISLVLRGLKAAARPVHGEDIVNGAVLFLMIVAFMVSFMHFRGVPVLEFFGIRGASFGRIAGLAALLLAAAYPLVGLAGVLTQSVLGSDAQPQELVKYFIDAAEKSRYVAIASTMVMGVVFAPIAEEFIFRGYFYGVLKRHLGIFMGIVLNAALFAAIHLNQSSMPSLFVLAVCLTLAYEFTGSILVNMCMHGLFNMANLCLLLYAAHQSAS